MFIVLQLLIEHSKSIGFIPDYIIEQIGQLTVAEQDKPKKKRRSGSLTSKYYCVCLLLQGVLLGAHLVTL